MTNISHIRINQLAFSASLVHRTYLNWLSIFRSQPRRPISTMSLPHRTNAAAQNREQSRENMHQIHIVSQELMRSLRSHADERLEGDENATLTPTTVDMDEFSREAIRLRDNMEDAAERISASIHMHDPPPRYIQDTGNVENERRAPIPSDASTTNEAEAAHAQTLESTLTQGGDRGVAALIEFLNRTIFCVPRRIVNPFPRASITFTMDEVSVITSQLIQIFHQRHPEMPIQQATYYATALRNTMVPHIQAPALRGRLRRSMRARIQDRSRENGLPVSNGILSQSDPSRQRPVRVLEDLGDLVFSDWIRPSDPRGRSTDHGGAETPESEPWSSGSSTLVNNSADDEVPIISVVMLPQSEDDFVDDGPAHEIHLPPESDPDDSTGESGFGESTQAETDGSGSTPPQR